MANINDYVAMYGNQSTNSMDFNEFDGLVLSELSYIKWDGIVPKQGENSTVTLGDAISSLRNNEKYYNSLKDDMKKLITYVESSERFSNMEMSNYNSINVKRDEVASSEDVKQFAAVTFSFNDASSSETQNFVAFRGTDDTLEGWQEDFNMAFDIDTEAQIAAAEYVSYIGKNLDGQIRVGGHSKGGNETCYSYLFCDDEVRDKIVKLYSYDGPGLLNDKALSSDEYKKMLQLLEGSAVAPYDSVIGLLLDEHGFVFVDTDKGVFDDHDAFSWQIDLENLSYVEKEQNYVSKLINETLDDLIHCMTPHEREVLINALWEFLYTQDVKNFDEVLDLFGEEKIGLLVDIYNSDSLNFEDKAIITATISVGLFFAAGNAIALGVEEAKEWVVKKTETIIVALDRKINRLVNSTEIKIKNFFVDLKRSVILTEQRISEWFNRNFNSGYRTACSDPTIRVDTAKLRGYAERLGKVNQRLTTLDGRMDDLYFKVGLRDLFNLIHADLWTGSNWRITNCAKYLNETANDFEGTERNVVGQFQG